MLSKVILTAICICSVTLTEACPSGWMQDVETCYYISTLATTWIQAGSCCKQFGGKLAEPTDQSRIEFLSGIIQNYPGKEYYIGGSDLFVEGKWIWTTTMAAVSVTHWASGEPNDEHHAEDCLLIRRDGTWNDENCTKIFPFICERESGIVFG